MDKTLKFELASDDPEEINRLLDQYIEAFAGIHQKIEKDQIEIDRITAETWDLLAQLQKAA
jgi:hypothetical protein